MTNAITLQQRQHIQRRNTDYNSCLKTKHDAGIRYKPSMFNMNVANIIPLRNMLISGLKSRGDDSLLGFSGDVRFFATAGDAAAGDDDFNFAELLAVKWGKMPVVVAIEDYHLSSL